MTTHNANNKELWLASFTIIVALLVPMLGATAWVTARVTANEVRLDSLENFAGKGDRCTSHMCDEMKQEIDEIQQWIAQAPPDWFENLFRDLVKRFENLEATLIDLKVEVRTLQNSQNP